MREPLHRGKRVDNNEWAYGGIVHQTDYYGDKVDRWFIIDGTETNDYSIGYPMEVIPETVGQYTGLTDKNGRTIFEGDIIKVSYDDEDYLTSVYAHINTLCVNIRDEDYDFTSIDFAVDLWENRGCEYEVIGNIRENSGLLGEE